MYNLEFTYTFEAAHRFTFGNSKCTTPHGHTWYATIGFESSASAIMDTAMVEEFAILKAQWKSFIQNTADHSFFHHWHDPIIRSLQENIPGFRGLPFPCDPTTEVIAALFLQKAIVCNQSANISPTYVTIRETPTNQLRFHRTGLAQILDRLKISEKDNAWWNSPNVDCRLFNP